VFLVDGYEHSDALLLRRIFIDIVIEFCAHTNAENAEYKLYAYTINLTTIKTLTSKERGAGANLGLQLSGA
jgi:hypothetical protein